MRIAAILGGLFLLGCGYNLLVAWLQRRGLGAFTAVQVVVGCLIALGGLTLWLPEAGLPGLACFAVAGAPMFWGSARRWWRAWHSS